ncbi:MAG: hypothetical protein ACTSU9_06335 [Promethearchaeota archaeon]
MTNKIEPHFAEIEDNMDEYIIRRFVLTDLLEVWLRSSDSSNVPPPNSMITIAVAGEIVAACKHIVMDLDPSSVEAVADAGSMDEIMMILRKREKRWYDFKRKSKLITAEEAFHVHCSNIQAWVEHGYDTRLMDSALAFPILEALSKAGDAQAFEVLKRDVKDRLSSGYLNALIALVRTKSYIKELTPRDWHEIFDRIPDEEDALEYARFIIIAAKSIPSWTPSELIPKGILERIWEIPDYWITRDKITFWNRRNKAIWINYPFSSPDELQFPAGPIEKTVEKIVVLGFNEPGVDGPLVEEAAWLFDMVADPLAVKLNSKDAGCVTCPGSRGSGTSRN